MSSPQTSTFPPEVLLEIASYCIKTFTPQELWFRLGRVSALFREVVELSVTTSSPERQILCSKFEAQWKGEHEPLQLFCKDAGKGRYMTWSFSHIDPRNPDRALFTADRLLAPLELDEEAPEMLARLQQQINDHKEATFSFTSITLELYDPATGDSSSGTASLGDPVYAEIASLPASSSGDEGKGGKPHLLVGFEWRKIWTLKCAPERKLEERQMELSLLTEDERRAVASHQIRGRALTKRERARARAEEAS